MENESCNLYLEASASGIEVAWFPLSVEPSMAIQFKDTCAIALDPVSYTHLDVYKRQA